MSLLEVRDLTKKFGGLAAVQNVSFDVNVGEILGLIGPNGAGKTTIYNLIAGVYKPTHGSIKFKGEIITGLKPHQTCRKGICRTFQITRPFAGISVTQNVMLGTLYRGSARLSKMKDAEKNAMDILAFVGLADRKDNLVKDLNAFQLKLLELARALATKPELLLLDEVAAGLNPVEIDAFMELLRKIHNTGITLLVVEHVMRVVMGISDRLVVLNYGEKIAEGPPQEMARNKDVIEAYLGEKYSIA